MSLRPEKRIPSVTLPPQPLRSSVWIGESTCAWTAHSNGQRKWHTCWVTPPKPGEISFASAGNLAFETAKKIFQSKVVFYHSDVMEVDKLPESNFDIIFCLGLLYHLRNPIAALEKLTQHCLNRVDGRPHGTIY